MTPISCENLLEGGKEGDLEQQKPRGETVTICAPVVWEAGTSNGIYLTLICRVSLLNSIPPNSTRKKISCFIILPYVTIRGGIAFDSLRARPSLSSFLFSPIWNGKKWGSESRAHLSEEEEKASEQ